VQKNEQTAEERRISNIFIC